MKKVLVTGANGFLGFYLIERLLNNYLVVATGKGECRLPFSQQNFIYESLDFTDPFNVHDVFEKHRPDIVIHAGAMSKPDECETDQWRAYITNTEGTVTLLLNAAECNSFFVFISTDFVFDGEKGMYAETDETGPVNFYGHTKREAEEAVEEYEHEWAIVRTVLVYGKPVTGRSNILTIVRDKLERGEEYNVVDDQVRTPTYVEDLADGIVSILDKKATGIFHLSGEEVMTPFDMAEKAAVMLGLDTSLLKRISSASLKQPARRPPRTGFVIDKAKELLTFRPIPFTEGLRRTFC